MSNELKRWKVVPYTSLDVDGNDVPAYEVKIVDDGLFVLHYDALAAIEAAKPKWIDINVQKPPCDGTYLTFSGKSQYKHNEHVWIAKQEVWFHELMYKKRSEFKPKTWVTHWQPLPTPPEPV